MLVMITMTFTDVFATSDQVAKDFDFILRHRTENQVSADGDARFTVDNVSELKTFATGLVTLYQVVISSQDIPACNFTPSCSRFTMEAIQKGGLLKGTLLGADRLMRCHWFARKQYGGRNGIGHDRKSDKLCDPLEVYLPAE
jgi:putative membrane protein insertion efficiency factor